MQLWIHLWELGVERRFSSWTFCSLCVICTLQGNMRTWTRKTHFNEFSLETIVCLFNECNHFPPFCWGAIPAGPQVCSMKAWAWLEVLFESWTDCVLSDFSIKPPLVCLHCWIDWLTCNNWPLQKSDHLRKNVLMVWLIKVICHQFPRLHTLPRWDHTFWRISVCVCGCYLITTCNSLQQ